MPSTHKRRGAPGSRRGLRGVVLRPCATTAESSASVSEAASRRCRRVAAASRRGASASRVSSRSPRWAAPRGRASPAEASRSRRGSSWARSLALRPDTPRCIGFADFAMLATGSVTGSSPRGGAGPGNGGCGEAGDAGGGGCGEARDGATSGCDERPIIDAHIGDWTGGASDGAGTGGASGGARASTSPSSRRCGPTCVRSSSTPPTDAAPQTRPPPSRANRRNVAR